MCADSVKYSGSQSHKCVIFDELLLFPLGLKRSSTGMSPDFCEPITKSLPVAFSMGGPDYIVLGAPSQNSVKLWPCVCAIPFPSLF